MFTIFSNIVLILFKLLFFDINIIKYASVIVAIKHLLCEYSRYPPVNGLTHARVNIIKITSFIYPKIENTVIIIIIYKISYINTLIIYCISSVFSCVKLLYLHMSSTKSYNRFLNIRNISP